MPRIKIFLFILIIVFASFLLKPFHILADQALDEQSYETAVTNGSFTKEDADKATLENIMATLTGFISGGQSLAYQQQNGPGAIQQLGSLIGTTIENPPVGTREYLADLGNNLGLFPTKQAYAQGIGWQALSPVLPIWKAFRNLTYLAFVIVFVVIGFMIIFRAKINPQTVISIQAALPNIVVTLLLVTFSYAIAGLMVDLIYIGIYLLTGLFAMSGLITDQTAVTNIILNNNPFGLVHTGANTLNWSGLIIEGPAKAIQDILGNAFGDWSKVQAVNVAGSLIKLILSVAVLFSLFRLFFSLVLSYLAIVLSVIFAPLNLLFNAIPGNDAFMGWLKNLFANVIVFPAVAGLFLIAAVLIGPKEGGAPGSNNNPWYVSADKGFYPQIENNKEVWVPPLLNISSTKGGTGSANNFQGLIALGMIMMSPQVLSMIKKILKVEGAGFGGTIVAGIMTGPKMVAAVPQTGFDLGVKLGYMGVGPFAGRGHQVPMPHEQSTAEKAH